MSASTIGRKQAISNEAWLEAARNIETLVSKAEVDAIAEKTIEDIRRKIRGKNVAFAWSGGKDSIVLEQLCREAGIRNCVLVVCNLEYPAFMQWVKNHKPAGLEVINTGQDLDWLAQHLDMLFPQNGAVAGRWFHIVQHAGQRRYYRKHALDMLLLGRRRADGNYVGRGTNVYSDSSGVTRFSPLADWKHEHILGFIHYHRLPLPPIYGWKNGYKCGTHPWPARQWTGSVENGWREVYEIDSSIVTEAALKIESARKFLLSSRS